MTDEQKLLRFPGAKSPGDEVGDRRGGFTAAGATNIQGYLLIIRRNRWLILSVLLVAGLIGWLKANSETPIYRAQLTLLIEPKRAKLGSIEDIVSNYSSPYRFYQTQYEIIRSRAVAKRIVEKLNADRYLWLDKKSKPGLVDAIRSYVSKQSEVNEDPPPRTKADKTAFLIGLVQSNLSVLGGDKSQIVLVRFESHDPVFAQEVVNGAADAYIEHTLDARLSAVKVASGWLNNQIEDLRQKVSESEARLQTFQAQESLVDSEKLQELVKGRLSALNESFTQAQSKVSALTKRYGAKHPSLIAAKAEMNELRSRLQSEKGTVVEKQGMGFELAKLERDVSTYRQLHDQFLTRFKETDLAMRYDINNVRVIDRASIPTFPVRPNKRQLVTSFLLAGLLIGIALAWGRDQLDNTFKNPQDVENLAGIPVLGIVPFLEKKTFLRKGGGLPERFFIDNKKSAFAESINHIRTGVLFTNVDNPPQIVMITSALPSEGKTTLSTNLALSFSQLGRTLLIDADLRKPRVAEISGLHHHGGLADVVAGHTKVADGFAQDRDSENLYIMKSGTQPPNPLELLSSEKFSRLIAELRKTFDHIVLDSPPVLPVSDAMVLGRLVDGVLIVIRSNKTNRSASINALNSMYKANTKIVGAVLSQVVSKKMSYYYPDNYHGNYGDYYGNQKAQA